MTKTAFTIYSAACIALVISFTIGGFIANESLYQRQASINSLEARKDDLLTQQQSIENLMNDLNQTLTEEIAKQELLIEELNDISEEKNLLIEKQKQASLAPPPPPEPVVITQTRTVTTQAS